MAKGDITLVFLNEALTLPGNRRASTSQPRTKMSFPEAAHNDAGNLWQEGQAYPTKFLWNLDWVILEFERDWLEWLQSVWVQSSYDPIEIWDESIPLVTVTPPTRAIAPGTTGETLSANKARFYPQCQATLAPGSSFSLSDSGAYFGAESWRLKAQLLEGGLLEYGGVLSPPVPGTIVPITSNASSSGEAPDNNTPVNNPPTLTLGSNSGQVAEDDDTSSPINLTTVTINDDGLGTNDLAITGAGTEILEIVGGQLRIEAGASLSAGTINATITVDDATVGSTPDDSEAFTLTITAANTAPTASSPQSFSAADGSTAGTSAGTVSATDSDGPNALTYTLASAVPDWDVNSSTGELTVASGVTLDFATTPNYSFVVNVSDGEDTTPVTVNIEVTELTMANVFETQNPAILARDPGSFDLSSYSVGDFIQYRALANDPPNDGIISEQHFYIVVDQAGANSLRHISGVTQSTNAPGSDAREGLQHTWEHYTAGVSGDFTGGNESMTLYKASPGFSALGGSASTYGWFTP